MAKGKSKKKSPPTTKSDGSMAVEGVEDGGGKEEMVILQSEDGKEFVMTQAEARNCGMTIRVMINYDSENRIIYSDDGGGEIKCRLVRLSVQSDALSRVIDVCNKRLFDPDWNGAKFVDSMDHAALFDFILAADYLRKQGLVEFGCRIVASMIDKLSPYEIRKMFNIRSYVTHFDKNKSVVKPGLDENFIEELRDPLQQEQEHELRDPLTLEQNALRALHLVRCQNFIDYDPKRNVYFYTRFSRYNIAFFDLDKKSRLARGPPLGKLTGPISRSSVQSAVNVLSLKVTKSDEGKKLSVFGTVIARDQVDYRCLYLFNRGRGDAQTIILPDGMLTLTDPSRGLVLSDEIFFEIDLMIKGDKGYGEYCRGVISLEKTRLPHDKQTMVVALNSRRSRVELTCAHVAHPVEATIAINVLKGPCNLSKVTAWASGNREGSVILYAGEADGIQTETGNGGGSVPLSRRVVALPLDTKLVLHLCGDDNVLAFLTLGQSNGQHVWKIGSAEVEVTVAWTCMLKRKRYTLEVIGDECLLH